MITTGMRFQFLRVPRGFHQKGPLDIHKHIPGGLVFAEGVWPLAIKGKDKLPLGKLSLNEHEARTADSLTRGTLEALCGAENGDRYVVLEFRQAQISALEEVLRDVARGHKLPPSSTQFLLSTTDVILRKLFILVANASQYLRECPSALVTRCTG